MCQSFWKFYLRWAGKAYIYVGLEGILDPATSSWLHFRSGMICLGSSKRPDSLTEYLESLQRQLKACSAAISHSFVRALVLVPWDDVAGSVSKENA